MKHIYGMALLAALAAAPISLEAQTPPPAPAPHAQDSAERRLNGAGPERLLRLRDELRLTAEQVSRLETIRQRLQQQNAPLIEQLRASGVWQERGRLTPEQREQMRQRMQNMPPEQREALRRQMQERRRSAEAGPRAQRQIPEELRPVIQQLRENTRSALQEARSVLTAEQQTRLRQLVQQRRAPARER